jgi:N-acetylneuraminic acid mutarotase
MKDGERMHELRDMRTIGLSLLLVGMLTTGLLAVLPGSAAAAFVPEWTAEPDLELGRSQAVVVTDDDGMIYVIGGIADVDLYDPVENVSRLDPNTGVWEELAPMPTPVRGACGEVGYDGRIYVIGGAEVFSTLALVQIYDPETDSWSTGTSAPETLWEAKSAVYGEYIYVLGGEGSLGDDSDCYIYDFYLDSWWSITDLPEPRVSGAAFVVGSYVYYAGGCSLGYSDPQDTVYRYYIWGAGVWEEAAPMPVPMAAHSAAVGADGMVYVLGGSNTAYNSMGLYNSTGFVYSYYADEWTALPDRSVGKKYLGAAATEDGRIFAVGGNNDTDAFSMVESITIATASVSVTPATVPIGGSAVVEFSFDFAYAVEEYSYAYWYMVSEDDVVVDFGYIEVPMDGTGMIAIDIEDYFALGDYQIHMHMDVDLETEYMYWDDYVVPLTVVDGDTLEEQIQALEEALAELKAEMNDTALLEQIAALEEQIAALEDALEQTNSDVGEVQTSVDDKLSATMGYAIIGLLVVVLVLLLVMMIMGRKSPPPPPPAQ